MIPLLRAELLRVASRRMPIGVVLAVSACLAVGAAVVAVRAGEVVDLSARWVDLVPTLSRYLVWLFAVVGASLVGSEFRSGGITQLANWEPRRGYVVAAKLVAAGITGVLGAAVLAAVVCLLVAALVAGGHVVAGVGSLGATEARIGASLLLACSLASVSGAALAFVVRSSAGAVVAVSMLVLVVEPLLGQLVDELGHRGPFHGLMALTGSSASSVLAHGGDLAAWLTAGVWVVLLGALAYQAFVAHDLRDTD